MLLTPLGLAPRHCRFASVLVATLSFALPVSAQPTARIIGSVEDATGAPLQAVTISLLGAEDRVTETGPDGRFHLENLPVGEYELRAAHPGFAPARRTLRLGPGDTLTVSLTLSVLLLEHAVVTAPKTGEQDVQTIPMAVSLLPATELQRLDSHTVAQLSGLAPSVTFSQNSDFAQLTIRGIGSTVVFAGTDPSSAVYVDGVYLARPVTVLADFLDLERVEVLRGPQGTLYGRNAVGGALNVITKPPTNDVEVSGRLAVGSLDTLRAEARVSGPIVPGRIMASGAVLRGIRQGFVRDLGSPRPSAWRRGCHGRARKAARRVRPAEQPARFGGPDRSGSGAADLREGSGREARVRGRQPSRSPRRPRVDARGRSDPAVRRGRPPHRAAGARDDADEPDGLPEAGLPRPERRRHHGAGSHVGRPARNAPPVVGGTDGRSTAAPGCVDRRFVSVRRSRPPTDIGPGPRAPPRESPRSLGRRQRTARYSDRRHSTSPSVCRRRPDCATRGSGRRSPTEGGSLRSTCRWS